MLEAYVGYCNAFDNRWGNASGGVLGDELKFKTQRGTDPFCGAELFRRYKDLRSYYFNTFMPAFSTCLNSFGATTVSNIPSGKTIGDVLFETLQVLWQQKESERERRIAAKKVPVVVADESKTAPVVEEQNVATVNDDVHDGEGTVAAGGTMLKPLPPDWIPYQFLAICVYGEPSLEPSDHFLMSVGTTPAKKKLRGNKPGVAVDTTTLDDNLVNSGSSNSRAAQRKESSARAEALAQKRAIARNKSRARRRLEITDDTVVSEDEAIPSTAKDDGAKRRLEAAESIVTTGVAIANCMRNDAACQRMRDVVSSAKALFDLDPQNAEWKADYIHVLQQSLALNRK